VSSVVIVGSEKPKVRLKDRLPFSNPPIKPDEGRLVCINEVKETLKPVVKEGFVRRSFFGLRWTIEISIFRVIDIGIY